MIVLIFAMHFFIQLQAFGQIAMPQATTIQLQKLINKSEEQIEALKVLLKQGKREADSLDKARRILEDLASGLDESIEKYQGTEVFEKALLEIQARNDFEKTYADSQSVRQNVARPKDLENAADKAFEDLIHFQKQSVKANHSDLAIQKELESALKTAPPGFVPKIATQAQLGNWQSNTRISAQLTELLAAIQAMREELRVIRLNEDKSNILGTLVKGSEIQNQKQRRKNNE